MASTLHIVFSEMAAHNLRHALRDAGRADRIACHVDNLALGPINPPDRQARLQWDEQIFRCASGWWREHVEEIEAFWKTALVKDVRLVAWMSQRSAPEYCGFLEWLWRLGDLPCEVIDLTEMQVGLRRPFSLSLLDPEEIAANAVWDRAEALDEITRSRWLDLWQRLRVENAPLRVVGTEGLRSAPITFFDQQLLSFANDSWQKPSRIIAEIMMEWVGPPMNPWFQAGDGILAARVLALVELGMLEGRGNLSDIRQSEVRRRTPAIT